MIDWNLVPPKKVTPVSDKENSPSLANVTPTKIQVPQPPCPEDEGVPVKACPVADEFDDADVLEALLAAGEEEEKKGTNAV